MKPYIKPELGVLELRVEEMFAGGSKDDCGAVTGWGNGCASADKHSGTTIVSP